jgi:hypothetical protein
VQPIARAIPKALAELLRDQPISPGKIEFAWKSSVGPAMARGTTVRLDDRTLIVRAPTRAWAREVARSSKIIVTRMQTLLGPGVITGISVRG